MNEAPNKAEFIRAAEEVGRDLAANVSDGSLARGAALARLREYVERSPWPWKDKDVQTLVSAVLPEQKKSITQTQEQPASPKQADILIRLAERATLFTTPAGLGYAEIEIKGHREVWPIRSTGFRNWLGHRYYTTRKSAPSSDAMQQALATIEARAQFETDDVSEVYVRVADSNGKVYIDLCDADWSVIEVTSSGWKVIDKSPVRFRRSKGMLPLPVPVKGGKLDELQAFINVKDQDHFKLIVGWLLAALRGRGPFPVLALSGEHGSAKSTLEAILRSLVDPNTIPLRSPPREERDLSVTANLNHVLAYDNISSIPPWLSDALCRLATGGGSSLRQLYTDQDEVLFSAIRPIILNGIEDFVERPDLADRAVLVMLQAIPEKERKVERKVWSEFNAARPRILGALLDGVAIGLSRLDSITLTRLPRMADFAIWGTACETAYWKPGAFMSAYDGNREKAVEDVLESDPVSSTLRLFLASRKGIEWTGTATTLLRDLAILAGEAVSRAKTWPVDATRLSARLRRLAPFLRTIGIEFEKDRDKHSRLFTIKCRPPEERAEIASSGSPMSPANEINDLMVTLDSGGDASSVTRQPSVTRSVTPNQLKSKGGDAHDAGDANSRLLSGTVGRAVPGGRLTLPGWSDDEGEE